MDWDHYQQLCDSPENWSRWMLEQTLALLQWREAPPELREALEPALTASLTSQPLSKPSDHRGGSATDMLHWTPALQAAQGLAALVKLADAAGFRTSGTISRGWGGFDAVWREYLAHAQQAQPAASKIEQREGTMGTATQRVVAMIDGWNRMDLDAIAQCFASDAIYHNIPMESVQGIAAIRDSLAGFLAMASEVQWDVLNIAEDANGVVLTERVDRFKIGEQWLAMPVMGVCEVRDDRICAWRDYFDLADFQTQMAKING